MLPTKYKDVFNFEIKNNILIVRRVDSHNGWGHEHIAIFTKI
jgi:hypothetical protein